ncbi:aspartyl-phosphate phosphatase Spo0E family protein [Heyndrickxia acidiproducens]|uniref:aspartyl-phosphate phosphatase Spo0E family protein n=1 Tax=Heyndrickxia acidiproducens TaxID=1121084 RepID=UPI0003A67D14|nr:aspartyl-phosphate phosphatase Spo0E family protein [Heyndrickxia acidiproducens]
MPKEVPPHTTHMLSEKIRNIREKMVSFAVQKGINHPDTIRQSQILDKLIYEYQLLSEKE